MRKIAEPRNASGDTDELRLPERRALLAERAAALYFFTLGCFVAAGFGVAADHVFEGRLVRLPVLAATAGMCLIVAGSAAMLVESRLAAAQVPAEITALTTSAPLKA